MRVEVAIPMRDESHLTRRLLHQLIRDSDDYAVIRIFDNGSRQRSSREFLNDAGDLRGVEIVSRPRATIYQMWNEAWRLAALRRDGTYCAILNNDIKVPAGFLRILAMSLRDSADDVWCTYPDADAVFAARPSGDLEYRQGTWRQGAMTGFAFMLDADCALPPRSVPQIDEKFRWHCGDGDLARQIWLRGGRTGKVVGLGIQHAREGTARRHAWTRKARREDVVYRNEKYAVGGWGGNLADPRHTFIE